MNNQASANSSPQNLQQTATKTHPSRIGIKENNSPSCLPSSNPERRSSSKPKIKRVTSHGLFREAHIVNGESYLKSPQSLINSPLRKQKNQSTVKSNEIGSLIRESNNSKMGINKQIDINILNNRN